MTNSEDLTHDDCLDGPIDCDGAVEYRIAMSPTGISYPRCDKHMEDRWERQQETSHRYGVPLTYYGNEYDGYDDDYSDY